MMAYRTTQNVTSLQPTQIELPIIKQEAISTVIAVGDVMVLDYSMIVVWSCYLVECVVVVFDVTSGRHLGFVTAIPVKWLPVTWLPVTHYTYGHVTSGHVTSGATTSGMTSGLVTSSATTSGKMTVTGSGGTGNHMNRSYVNRSHVNGNHHGSGGTGSQVS